jgi:hypothetical protein
MGMRLPNVLVFYDILQTIPALKKLCALLRALIG